ncbi:ABC transporter substrate-binding protein [Tepidibacillus fermentans]|uniref:NitT/TauT family transport system substrate-binding protein n=1 Tax=Tepidibacillus fermentans TaxID=1281767 RepID=A0A4R3KIW0_9BACI|nr:ABC transporter substrate-binding protein [Tepidibacillus fermentans]TCS83476.1 NitT/TauT family transport system substrate-binding protein [Tepidibacillus fermentans]
MTKALKISFIILIFTTFTFFAGCSDSATPKTQEKIRLAEVTHSIFYTPLYVAIEKGFFKEQGLEVELFNANGGDKTMTALVSGSADIILVGTETTIYVYSQNPKDPAINFAQLTQTDGSFLVSRKPIDFFKWDMLKGKVLLGQRKGGMPEMVSEYVQVKQGIRPKVDNTIIQNVDFANLGTAFVSGTGDFVQLFEPVASKIEAEGKGYVVASFGKDSGKLPYTVFITRQSMINQSPEKVQKFTNAIYKAQQWVENHTIEEIADVIQPQFQDLDRKIMLRVLDRYRSQGSWATDPIIDEAEYHNLERVMENAGELKSKAPYEKIVNTDFARKAMR